MEEALTHLRDQDPIVIWDLCADIRKIQNPCNQYVSEMITEIGLIDLLNHFRKRWWYWNVKMCSQERQERLMQESSICILGTHRCCFEMVGIRGVRNYP